jgi:hypothetical protein
MTDHHPIAPPKELMQQMREQVWFVKNEAEREERLIERAAQWGYEQRGEVNEAKLLQARDHQLDATLAEVSFLTSRAQLLLRRLDPDSRPKPPTQAEIALEQYDRCVSILEQKGYSPAGCIRAALERLKQLEDSNV